MQFSRDEYMFLSRRGSVPVARRSPRRVPESEPAAACGAEPGSVALRRVNAGAQRAIAASQRCAASVRAYRAGVGGTWAAFGSGARDEFGGR